MKTPRYNAETWIPVTESGEHNTSEFDKRFLIDRIFETSDRFFKYRIRFVQHPDCAIDKVNVCILRMRKMPKWYWHFTEKYMVNMFEDFIIKTDNNQLTFDEVINRYNYIIL